jgi:hypothetical protein
LWARLADMRSRYVKVFPLVVDLSHPFRYRVNSPLSIEHYGIIPPRRLQEFVHQLDILFSLCVPLVMLCAISLCESLCNAADEPAAVPSCPCCARQNQGNLSRSTESTKALNITGPMTHIPTEPMKGKQSNTSWGKNDLPAL